MGVFAPSTAFVVSLVLLSRFSPTHLSQSVPGTRARASIDDEHERGARWRRGQEHDAIRLERRFGVAVDRHRR